MDHPENPVQECLFGWPPLPERGRGRPPVLWTHENSNKVKVLLAVGWNNDRIANALNISAPTLRRVYFRELKVRAMARDALRAEMLARTVAVAMTGNVGAMKLADRLIGDDMRETAMSRARGNETDNAEEPKPAARGKKETAVTNAGDLLAGDPLLRPARVNH